MATSNLWSLWLITDVSISRKARRESSSPFAFARFHSKEEALKACQEIHGMVVEGLNLVVTEAKERRHVDISRKVDSKRRQGSTGKHPKEMFMH